MSRKIIPKFVLLPLMLLLLFPLSSFGAKEPPLVGTAGPNFTLPSTQDRLINYFDEYYGKRHLIITFFPAAFTPT